MLQQEKFHHLVPKNYLDGWAKDGAVMVAQKGEDATGREVETLFSGEYRHVVVAGMAFATKEDTDALFYPLKKMTCYYREEELVSTLDMNRDYDFFEDWEIKRRDGSHEKKKPLKHMISQSRIDSVEDGWYEGYESAWAKAVSAVEEGTVSQELQDYFLGMFLSLEWNTLEESPLFAQVFSLVPYLKHIDPPKKQGVLGFLNQPDRELFHWFLFGEVRRFLSGTGVIPSVARLLRQQCGVQFVVAKGSEKFLCCGDVGFMAEGVGYFPISSTVLMVFGEAVSGEDMVSAEDDLVKEYNEKIGAQRDGFLVYPQ